MVSSSLACLVAALLAQAPGAAPRPIAGNPRLEPCIVTLFEEVQIPASVPGRIISIPVAEGQGIAWGQPLAQLDDNEVVLKKEVTEIEYIVAMKQAEQDVKVKVAEASMKVAKQELAQGERLKAKMAISDSEMTRLTLAYDRARYEYDAAVVENQIQQQVVTAREAQLDSADNDIELRKIRAPLEKEETGFEKSIRRKEERERRELERKKKKEEEKKKREEEEKKIKPIAGRAHLSETLVSAPTASADDWSMKEKVWIVEKLLRHVGEWVQPGEPVMTLVKMDKVKVEGFLNSTQYSPAEVFGKPVTVEVVLERGRRMSFTGTIGYVSTKVDAAGEYRVWASVDNKLLNGHYQLRSGLKAAMTIHVTGQPAGAVAPPGALPR